MIKNWDKAILIHVLELKAASHFDLFSIGSKKNKKINNVSHISTVVVQLHKMAAFILFHFDKLAAVLQCPLLSRQKQNNLFC